MTARRRAVLLAALSAALGLGLLVDLRAFGAADAATWAPDVTVGWAFLVAAGAVALRAHGCRLAALLALIGATWFAGSLAPGLAVLHRGPLVHLAFAYPSGRLARTGLVTVPAAYVAAVVPAAWGSEPGTVALAAALVLAAVLHRRAGRGPLGRARQQAALVTTAVACVLVVSAVLRFALPGGEADAATLLAYQLTLLVVAVLSARAAASRRWHPAPVTDLVLQLGGRTGAVAEALARVLHDPSLRVGYRVGAGFADASGRAVVLPEPGDGRGVTSVLQAGEQVAVLVHDDAVLADQGLLDAVAAAARLSEQNARLQAQVEQRLRDVQDSRERLLVAADSERGRLAQRLADGAGRRLAELTECLERARSATADEADGTDVERVQAELDRTRRDLRALAEGLEPCAPASGGLRTALLELARRSPLSVTVTGGEVVCRSEVGAAVWFVCAEALANAARHAHATRACIELTADADHVRLTVADDGSGGADPAAGTGLRGLQDRVETLGGVLTVGAGPDGGTLVQTTLPSRTTWPGQQA